MRATSKKEFGSRASPTPRKVVSIRRAFRSSPKQHEDRRRAINNSLKDVLDELRPIVQKIANDQALAQLVLSEPDFIEPLSRFEMKILACGLYKHCATNEPFDYSDVLHLTDKFAGKAMNVTMIYRTIAELVERGLVVDEGRASDERSGRPTNKFSVSYAGREVFRLSVLSAQQLKNARESAAA